MTELSVLVYCVL